MTVARTGAGVMTSLGLVMLLIALIVVPAVPVLAATPTLEVTTACDPGDNHNVDWTTTSTDPTPGGGTADGAVTVTQSIDYQGVITETTVVGEYNDANGYSMSGSFEGLDGAFVPGLPPALVKVTVEVDQFNDGTGVGSVVMSSWIRIDVCKDGTTTTGATTTTVPVTTSAEVTAACVLDNGVASYPITVTVFGDEGATGTVTINGVDFPYTIGAGGSAVIAANGMAGSNTIDVVDDSFGSILSDVIELQDCSPTTTTEPPTTTTTEPPTTTTEPTTTTTAPTTTTTEPPTTTTEPTTTTTAPTTTTTEPPTTTTEGATTTTESSSNTGTPPVSVLPTVVEQNQLPQTGIDNGPLAMMGIAMLIGGAALLVTARRREALVD